MMDIDADVDFEEMARLEEELMREAELERLQAEAELAPVPKEAREDEAAVLAEGVHPLPQLPESQAA